MSKEHTKDTHIQVGVMWPWGLTSAFAKAQISIFYLNVLNCILEYKTRYIQGIKSVSLIKMRQHDWGGRRVLGKIWCIGAGELSPIRDANSTSP